MNSKAQRQVHRKKQMAIWHLPKRFLLKLQCNFFFVFVGSLLWLGFRTGTKPSRIAYPCQRAALANVGLFATALPVVLRIDRCRISLRKATKRSALAILLLAAGPLVVFSLTSYLVTSYSIAGSWATYRRDARTGPVGKRVSATRDAYTTIPSANLLSSPHRVVSVHDSKATSWTGVGNPADTMNQEEIDAMIDRGVRELTGEATAKTGWQKLIPYQPGESVAIKMNFNNVAGCDFTRDANMNAYATVANSVINALESIGVPAERIWIADPSRPINDAFRSRITDANIQYYTKCSAAQIGSRNNVFTTSYVSENSPDATLLDPAYGVTDTDRYIRPAQVFADAAHIINIPQLKGHALLTEVGGISLGLKNHFGSVSFTYDAEGSDQLHSNPNLYRILGDINANPVFFNKTRLVIGDGLMGNPTTNLEDPVLWSTFGNQPPKTFFFGVDPVAVDSVMFDYVQRECAATSQPARNDKVSRYAASIGLGVLEHWTDDTQRQYSVIDYREIDVDNPLTSVAVTPTAPSIAQGTTQQFTATGTFHDGSARNLTHSVTWSSTNSTVAAIASNGLATARTPGITTIQAVSDSINGSTNLTVSSASVPDFIFRIQPSSLSVREGETTQASLTISPLNGFKETVTFLCSGLPTAATCGFDPAAVTPDGTSLDVTLTIHTMASSARLDHFCIASHSTLFQSIVMISVAGSIWSVLRRMRPLRKSVQPGGLVVAFLVASFWMIGCKGLTKAVDERTPVGKSIVTVTAFSDGSPSITHSAAILLSITN